MSQHERVKTWNACAFSICQTKNSINLVSQVQPFLFFSRKIEKCVDDTQLIIAASYKHQPNCMLPLVQYGLEMLFCYPPDASLKCYLISQRILYFEKCPTKQSSLLNWIHGRHCMIMQKLSGLHRLAHILCTTRNVSICSLCYNEHTQRFVYIETKYTHILCVAIRIIYKCMYEPMIRSITMVQIHEIASLQILFRTFLLAVIQNWNIAGKGQKRPQIPWNASNVSNFRESSSVASWKCNEKKKCRIHA